jgi:L,D-transpeptidase YcbB
MNTPRRHLTHRNRPDRSRLARSLKPALTPVLALAVLLVSACGPSREELERRQTETLAALNATLSGEGLAPAARSELEQRRAWVAMREFYGTAGAAPFDGGGEAGAESAEEAEPPEEVEEEAGTVWVDGEGPRETIDSLIAVLGGDPGERREAREKGEESIDASGVGRLAELRDDAARAVEQESEDMARRMADLELAASYAFLTRAIHTLEGRVDPRELNVQWFTEGRKAEPLKLLARVRDGAEPTEVLADLEPGYAAYERLLEARDRYRAIVERGGWKRVPAEGPALEEGARGPRVAALRQRLAAEGDLSLDLEGESDAPEGTESAVYDAAVAEAVERFQERMGIEPDGKIGPATLEELNVPAEERLRAIELNLERWRWMPGELGDHYIEVNIPEYRLRAIRNGETELAMNVIVGERLNQTPVFSDRMQYIVINPEWNIPESIADSEVVPKIVANAGYAESQGIEVVNAQGQRVPARSVLGRRTLVSGGDGNEEDDGEGDERDARRGFFARVFGLEADDSDEERGVTDDAEVYTTSTTLPAGYRLRQAPGPENPLGEVKFMFPNEHNIYLHDTPGDSLFARLDRGFSHGCIRLERPLELADYVLRGDGEWNGERVRRVIASGERTEVRLPEEIPVHLTYFTAWVGEDGRVHFRDDLYGHDARLAEALAEEEPLMIDPAALRGT